MKNYISYTINSTLPYMPFNMTSSTERYGFCSLLCEQIGMTWRPRSFASWMHGWIWWGATSSTELQFDSSQKKYGRFVVSRHFEKTVLESEGFKDVKVGGLPFAYSNPSDFKRESGSLLAMPPHSSEREKLNKSHIKYLNYLESIKNNYSNVSVCIHYLDLTQSIINEVKKRGMYLIEGARPDDANSLKRIRAIFDSFEFVTTNSIGSHVIYALFSGCKVSLCGPLYEFDESDLISNNKSMQNSKKYIYDLLFYLSKKYLEKNFSFILVNNPDNGFSSENYARKEIGYLNKLSNKEVRDTLRWTPFGQAIGYTSGAIRRFSRKF